MSEPTNTPPVAGNEGGTTAPAGDEFKPITSQDDLNRVINDRLARERAKYADYKDVKKKADEFDKVTQASKSEQEKFAERVAALEKENQTIRSDALRSRIQAKYSISDEDADLFLTGTDEDSLTRQAERLAGKEADRKKQGNVAPKEGANNSPATGGTEREFVRGLFSGSE
jgi:hypothetical protein